VDARARGWLVSADGDLVLGSRPPFAWRHRELATGACDAQHRERSVAIKLAVEPLYEVGRGWLRQRSAGGQPIHLRLDPHVCRRFELQVTPLLVSFEVTGKRPFDVPRTRVVALDEIAVVGVHDAYDIREVRGGARVQRATQPGRRR